MFKYINYLESHEMIEEAREVYSRAGGIHLPKKIAFHLEWAIFEEKHGFKETAVKVLSNIETYHREVVKIPVLKAGVYRRMGNLTKACEALLNGINNATNRDNYVYLTLKLARFKAKVEGDFNGALEVLQQALIKYPVNEKLHLCLIDLEYSGRQVINVNSFCEACDVVIANTQIPLSTRVKFSGRKLELLEDIGTELSEIVEAREEYGKLSKEQNTSRGGVSRDSETSSGEPPEKKPKLGATSATNGLPTQQQPVASHRAVPMSGGGPPVSTAPLSAAQYPNYYHHYQWPSYYGTQQYPQQYPAQYWGGGAPPPSSVAESS